MRRGSPASPRESCDELGAARLDQEERTRYLDAISMLREEKQELLHELERAAGLAKALGLARPSALA